MSHRRISLSAFLTRRPRTTNLSLTLSRRPTLDMMQLKWRDELMVGLPEVDGQHKEFVARINTLLAACSEGKGAKEVGPVAAFLEDYVEFHFSAEERLMASHSYPALKDHKEQHQYFRDEFAGLKASLHRAPAGAAVALQLNQLLVKWFTDHISTEDRDFAEYLEDQGAAR
jgi:hemerythrin